MIRKQRNLAMWLKRWKERQSSGDSVVLTKMNLYRSFGALSDSWDQEFSFPDHREQGSPDFRRRVIRLKGSVSGSTPAGILKSESEDSGMELASSDNSPSTPLGSVHSLSMGGSESSLAPSISDLRLGTEKEDSSPSSPALSRRSNSELPEIGKTLSSSWSTSKKLEQLLLRTESRWEASPAPSLRGASELEAEAGDTDSIQTAASNEQKRASRRSGKRSIRMRSQSCETLDECFDACWRGDVVDGARGGAVQLGSSQGLGYLEQVCRMLEQVARLQKTNQLLQRQKEAAENRLRGQASDEELFYGRCLCGAAEEFLKPGREETRRSHMDLAGQCQHQDSFLPAHYRKRSRSDTQAFLNFKSLGESDLPSPHFISAGNLLETLPETQRPLPTVRAEHTHWGKIKHLVKHLQRRSEKSETSSSTHLHSQEARSTGAANPKRRFVPLFKKRGQNQIVR
ncbi:hypothetical protein AOXY_G28626 [Acipenser oxyrinchus oxyrinchus]|uniref:DUF4657 domain-containing protein n=1 Tax=Acipenser oxyrinchus oxyrinchus TaxID=40147 RepID=A0AAD8CMG5_ACIOX|nr:hypothetical protein AOXY_G28626 [Acipenser oxyrinchus oxyrinchus]